MSVIRGKGLPTRSTKGALGDIYIDQTTGRKYKCVGATTMQTLGKADSDYQWKFMSDKEAVVDTNKPVEKAPEKEVKSPEQPKPKKEAVKKEAAKKEEVNEKEVSEEKVEEEPIPASTKRTNYAAAYKQDK